ncbi:MAG TPA: tRNA pseudouridine(55) synthase TruB [Candidatus Binataceae bacterium]|nr:tRNA pseudouridine(55) synthase TruB [Candidatus Binataceae bacterium]
MDGIILIDKPSGITSAEVVRRIKAKVMPSRVGHLGTLDPFATGVLPIMIGEATKLAPMLEGGEKVYAGVIKLGAETDTLDRDGKIVREAPVSAIDADSLAEVAKQFTGKIDQVPPVFSAIKRDGVRMYQLARKGNLEELEPPPIRNVEIKDLSLELTSPDEIGFVATCSPGTYARALARDIGIALGTVAHLKELRRTRSGHFAITDAVNLDEALKVGPRHLIGLRDALPDLAELNVDDEAEKLLRNGDPRALEGRVPAGHEMFKVIHDGHLIAVAKATSRVTAIIVRVFNTGNSGAD